MVLRSTSKIGRFLMVAGLVLLVGILPLVAMGPLSLNAQSKVSFPLSPPQWYPGDTWAWTGPRGNVVAMTVTSAATDGSYTIAGMGAGVRPNMEWGALFQREQVGNFLFLSWPLTYNKRWTDVGRRFRFVWRVGPVQTVTLPDGTSFSAVELLCSVLTPPAGNPPVQKFVGTGFAWYAPAAKTIVKIRFGPEAVWPDGVRNKALTLTKYRIHSLNVQTTANYPLNPPKWYPGDAWSWMGPRGAVMAMTVSGAATDGSYTIAGVGGGIRPNMEWGALFKRQQMGNFLFLDWPLTYNKRWTDVGPRHRFVWRVGPVQTVTLPDGTSFSAVELLCSVLTPPAGNPPVQNQVGTAFAWYAPAAKTIVKIQFGPEAVWPDGVRNKAVILTNYVLH